MSGMGGGRARLSGESPRTVLPGGPDQCPRTEGGPAASTSRVSVPVGRGPRGRKSHGSRAGRRVRTPRVRRRRVGR